METLTGTTALVTGASSGIGAATAIALAERGCRVAAIARRADRLDEVVEAIRAAGGAATAIECDVADSDAAANAVATAVDTYGGLDVVVNNAGVMYLGPVRSAPLTEWHEMVQVNVTGVLNITHAALPHLVRAAEHGPRAVADLVNVSSVGGRRASAGTAVYNATKFAVSGLTEAMRQELSGHHVRVAAIEPGMVTTEVLDRSRPGALEEVLERFGRAPGDIERLTAHDVARSIVHVVSSPRHVAIAEVLLRPTEQL